MPVIKVRENEPFDVALRRFDSRTERQRQIYKYALVIIVGGKQPLDFSVNG